MVGDELTEAFRGLHHPILTNCLHLELPGSPSRYVNEALWQHNTRKGEEQSMSVWTYSKALDIKECVLEVRAVSFGM